MADVQSDLLVIRPLGAGQEVGRSCIMLEFKGKKIMLDIGIHPGMHGVDALPFTDLIDANEIDILLVSHFHLDHCGALPWFLEKTTFKGRVFMTHASKAIYRWLLSDYIKVSNISTVDMLYSEKDLENSMDKIETVNFHQEMEVNGIKFWCYHAGHVLGAAMFMLEIAGVKILYTGDFSRQEDRHLMAAEIPPIKPDILITEATYGTQIHEKREVRETRFTSTVHDIVNRGGRCLIPVFALGRAQELLLILDEYWDQHPDLHDIPIYYASSLAKKCMAVYQTYINAMNDKIRKQIAISNPFHFKHISYLKGIDQFDDIGPSVVMASPGMMQSGLSRQLFESWCTEKRNGVVIAGYCVEGTLAKHLMSEPDEINTAAGAKLARKCSIDYISFSAHSDYEQTSTFIRILKPPHIVLVHGEQNEMSRLKAALIREYEDTKDSNIAIYNPRNTESVELHFKGEKTVKVVGSLASSKPKNEANISGILVKKGFNYTLVSPSDLAAYTDLSPCVITQRQTVAFGPPLSVLKYFMRELTGDLEAVMWRGKPAVRVFKAITIVKDDADQLVLEWVGNHVNDMYADAVLGVILQIESNPAVFESTASEAKPAYFPDDDAYPERLIVLLQEVFGEEHVDMSEDGLAIVVSTDESTASVDIATSEVTSVDDSLLRVVSSAVARLQSALTPCTGAPTPMEI
ncbi:cleavage and polyadenylation specificity factor subunit 3-like [Oscarella lobularis]|uniref:cleavage and polyadenylation specificity factor subunit 3-like n=1 Tax=Oscarella lobularis TaxID=121494 RepID=UPI003313BF67